MADFERTAEVSVVIPDRELRNARQELEDALADIPVGVDATGTDGTGGVGGGRSSRERRRDRREFRWARQRTDDVERQVELLENIEGELTEGGLGGGGGLFGDLLGLGGEGAGIATDLGTSVVDLLAPALGSLVGTAVGQQVDGGGGGGGGGDFQIQEPLGVTVENTPLDVRDDGGGPSVTVEAPDFDPVFNPEFSPTFNPEFSPTFSPTFAPETNILSQLEELNIGGGSGLTEPVDVVVTNTPLSVSGRRATGGRPAPTGGGGGGGGVGGVQIGGPNGITIGPGGIQAGGNRGITLGRDPGDPTGAQGGGAGPSVSTGAVNVTVNADVQGAVQQAVEQVRREQERQRQELRRDLENQISDLRRQISSGGRSGLGGSVT